MEIRYIKCAARLLDRDYVNKKGLDLSKEVLWVYLSQVAAKLKAVHVVLKSSIRTLALPRRLRFYWGLRVTQDAYFSLSTHTKQPLLVTFCYTTAGIGANFRTHA